MHEYVWYDLLASQKMNDFTCKLHYLIRKICMDYKLLWKSLNSCWLYYINHPMVCCL